MASKNTTIEWWKNRRSEFAVFISEFVIAESSQGDSDAAARRMTVIEGIPELNISEEVKDLAKALIAEGHPGTGRGRCLSYCCSDREWYGLPAYSELYSYCKCRNAPKS